MNDLCHALSKFRRGKLVECIAICDRELENNPGDQAAWYVPSVFYPLSLYHTQYTEFIVIEGS